MSLGVRTQEQEDSMEAHIARDVVNGESSGAFLEDLCAALLLADRDNFEVLRPLVRFMIAKYDLKCTCGAIEP